MSTLHSFNAPASLLQNTTSEILSFIYLLVRKVLWIVSHASAFSLHHVLLFHELHGHDDPVSTLWVDVLHMRNHACISRARVCGVMSFAVLPLGSRSEDFITNKSIQCLRERGVIHITAAWMEGSYHSSIDGRLVPQQHRWTVTSLQYRGILASSDLHCIAPQVLSLQVVNVTIESNIPRR